jgi:hypothetical protein
MVRVPRRLSRREEAMKKILIFLLLGTTVLAAVPAHADPLPDVYLGGWCLGDSSADPITTKEERKECVANDNVSYLEIKRDGYLELRHYGGNQTCKFVSIKQTGEKWPASTKPRKEDWIPLVRVLARCEERDDKRNVYTYNELLEMVYSKGVLSMFMKRITTLNNL